MKTINEKIMDNKNKLKDIKRIIALMFAIFTLMLNSVVYADEVNNVAETTPQVYEFSLESAIEYAIKNNKDIMNIKLQQDQMGYSISEVRTLRKTAVDMMEAAMNATDENGNPISISDNPMASGLRNFDSYLLRQKYTESELKSREKILEKSKILQEEITKFMVENAYYNVLITQIKYDDAKRNCDVITNQKNVGTIKLSAGLISDMTYKSLEISEKAAQISLVNAEFALKESKMDFNELLGLELNAVVNLTTALEPSPKELIFDDNKKEMLKQNDLTFANATHTYTFFVEYEKYAKAYYGKNNNNYKSINSQLKTHEITYANAKNTLERKIMSTYNNLEVLGKTVQIMKEKAELMKLALGITNIRKNYGTATEDEVINASIEYNNALNEYYEMVLNYNMLVSMFEKNIMA